MPSWLLLGLADRKCLKLINVDEERGRGLRCGLELPGPPSHSQGHREGQVSHLSHTVFRGDG